MNPNLFAIILFYMAKTVELHQFNVTNHFYNIRAGYKGREKVNLELGHQSGDQIFYKKIHLYIFCRSLWLDTYDHRSVKTGHPVRSAIHKH